MADPFSEQLMAERFFDRCVCGHFQSAHIYGEGACRPGFPCPERCILFKTGTVFPGRVGTQTPPAAVDPLPSTLGVIMAVQARFYIAQINQYATVGGYAAPAPAGQVVMRPVTRGEANKDWASATPSGEFTMTVHGTAFPWFQDRLGKELAITFEDRPEGEV